MMKKNSVIVLSVLLFSAEVFANEAAANLGQAANQTRETRKQKGARVGGKVAGNAQAGATVQETQTDTIQEASVDNVKNGQKGQSVAFLMAGALAGAAAKYYGMCTPTTYTPCVIGGVMAAMAVQSKKSGKSFNGPNAASWNNVCEFSSSGCSGAMPNPYSAIVADNADEGAIERARKLAASKGIKVDAESGIVTLKDGKIIDPNDPTSMSAALGGEGSADLMKKVSDIEKDAVAKVESIKAGRDSYGIGSGGAGDGTLLGEGGYDLGDEVSGSGLKGRLRKPAQVTGLTKKFNGDPIGVSGDDIFGMMKRRYILKSNQKTFFGPELQ